MIRNETARLLRRTAPALATLPLALALSGCGTLTGLNAENDFSCPMTPGGSCRSLSDTYEDSVRGRTPDRIERDKAIEAASKGLPEIEGTNGKAADETPAGPAVQTVKADAAQASVAAPAVRAPERRSSPRHERKGRRRNACGSRRPDGEGRCGSGFRSRTRRTSA